MQHHDILLYYYKVNLFFSIIFNIFIHKYYLMDKYKYFFSDHILTHIEINYNTNCKLINNYPGLNFYKINTNDEYKLPGYIVLYNLDEMICYINKINTDDEPLNKSLNVCNNYLFKLKRNEKINIMIKSQL